MKSPFTRLLEGEPIAPPVPLVDAEDIVAVLDWMSEIHHGPDGRGPENRGAALALAILAYELQKDSAANRLVGRIRAAIAHEEPAERRAPSASTALEAFQALDHLADLHENESAETTLRPIVSDRLPTPIHARYALSMLLEGLVTRGDFQRYRELFDLVARRLAEHPESGEPDREYVARLRERFEEGERLTSTKR